MKKRKPAIPPRLWTEADIHMLRQMAGKTSVVEIAARLGRTRGAVVVKAGYLGISLLRHGDYNPHTKYSDADVETIRGLYLDGVPRREIMQRYPHIHPVYISMIGGYHVRLGALNEA
jgi:hypothetical protein